MDRKKPRTLVSPLCPFVLSLVRYLFVLRPEHSRAAQHNSRRRDIIRKFSLIFSRGGLQSREDTRRSGATTFRGRQFRTVALRPTRFHAFQFARVRWSLPRLFSPNPFSEPSSTCPSSSRFLYSVVPYLIRGPLIRTRGRARSAPSFSASLKARYRSPLWSSSSYFLSLSTRNFSLACCTRAKKHAPLKRYIIAWPFGS